VLYARRHLSITTLASLKLQNISLLSNSSPPVGLNLYIIKGMSGYPMKTVFNGVYPFVTADVFHLALLVAFPQISLLIPGLMK